MLSWIILIMQIPESCILFNKLAFLYISEVNFLSTNIQNDHGDSIIHYLLRKCDLFHWHITMCILGVWLVYVHGDESEIQASAWCRWSDEQSPTFPWSHHFSDQPIPGQGCHPYRGYVCTYAKVLWDFNENQHLLLSMNMPARNTHTAQKIERFVQNITTQEKTPLLWKC